MRVGESPGANETLTLANRKAPKKGYCYIYLSNASEEAVYFDNLQVAHTRGRIIEENHYYPFGLKIAAISSKKLGDSREGSLKNGYLYQGSFAELDEDMGWTDFALRSYDGQIGRFTQQDPFQQFPSPYTGMGNDPVNTIDPTGGFSWPPPGLGTVAAASTSGVGKALQITGQGSSLVSKISMGLQVASITANTINSSVTTYDVGSIPIVNTRGGPNAEGYSSGESCCDGDPVQDLLQLAKDFYEQGILPGLDWINHNTNPSYSVWNAGYSHFTGLDFLDQTPVNKTQTKVDAMITLLPGGLLEKGAANAVGKVMWRATINESSSVLKFSVNQLQKKFKHAFDFGIVGNYSKANAARFSAAINKHINSRAVRVIYGTYKGEKVIHYLNPITGRNVISKLNGEFISGWKLGGGQLQGVLKNGTLW